MYASEPEVDGNNADRVCSDSLRSLLSVLPAKQRPLASDSLRSRAVRFSIAAKAAEKWQAWGKKASITEN
jgi:hypothetical protein